MAKGKESPAGKRYELAKQGKLSEQGKKKPKTVVAISVSIGKPKKDKYMDMLAKTMGKNAGPSKK